MAVQKQRILRNILQTAKFIGTPSMTYPNSVSAKAAGSTQFCFDQQALY